MGKFKRSKRTRKLVEYKCFEDEGLFIVCKKVKGSWVQLDHRTYDTCKECTQSIGTTECF